ncbi:MAG: type IV secretion system protein VirJ [Sphingobium sp.]|nr:MAG: type IV secretion system protein VirJ [Sphingobium sp.]
MMARSGKSIRYILPILILALLAATFQWLGYLGGDPFSLSRPQGYRPGHGTPIAIILSGDMGMKVGMGPGIMARLARDGLPTVGVNSLTYFRKTRSPAEATALAPVILIGQSFGADMAHVGLAALPPAQRHAIAMVALVVPGATVEYRASPGEIFTFAMAEADALPTARKFDWAPLLCVHGQEEAASLCPLLHQANVQTVALPGGHPLHHDVDALYHVLHAAFARQGLIRKT